MNDSQTKTKAEPVQLLMPSLRAPITIHALAPTYLKTPTRMV